MPHLLLLVMFRVVAASATQRHRPGIANMRELAVRTFPAARNFIEPGIQEVPHQLSDFSRHTPNLLGKVTPDKVAALARLLGYLLLMAQLSRHGAG